MPSTTNVTNPNANASSSSTQSEQDSLKEASIRSLQREDQLTESGRNFPSGWWIVPLMFIGLAFWIVI